MYEKDKIRIETYKTNQHASFAPQTTKITQEREKKKQRGKSQEESWRKRKNVR